MDKVHIFNIDQIFFVCTYVYVHIFLILLENISGGLLTNSDDLWKNYIKYFLNRYKLNNC